MDEFLYLHRKRIGDYRNFHTSWARRQKRYRKEYRIIRRKATRSVRKELKRRLLLLVE